ncbi:phosphatase PAP2 family protein [Candidatus Protochlamydia sp. R18]|uniref:phosphatase PAP2 family protein n=1 Tax=Candidatus Protochlamydia sp. R18 TaxID=1353977 RepID=UPI0005AB4991|nr:phosphatase PAP2 family protein [Candidatus Protochlamydia sp. R18]
MPNSFSKTTTIFLPLLAVLLFTLWSTPIDLAVSQYFYRQGEFDSSPITLWIYHYAIFPAWIVVGLAICGSVASIFLPRLKFFRPAFLYLILVLAIGSGIFVHAIFKDHWGRPRPKQIIEFGGAQPFLPYYKPRFNHSFEPSKSFPCGHCSVGFYFFSFLWLGKHYRSYFLYILGLFLTISLGGALSYARLVQGGHFFSDVVFSALIMWLTSIGCYQMIFKSGYSP